MKKVISLTIGLMLAGAVSAYAASDVKGVVVNKSDVKGSANVAAGIGNKAQMGTIGIEGSRVKGV
ncbi:MAG: hypothetical protein KAI75_01625, partial [Desulfobulbaceae bacterium]|nr:hypothetical protein [Desulfobulbaceae bacterium]